MAFSVFPDPVISTTTSWSGTATAPNTAYRATLTINPGVYRVSCVSTTIATVEFLSGTTLVGTARTSSGTIDINISSNITDVQFYTNTGSNIIIQIQFLASQLAPSTITGTVDTLSTSGTYTTTSTSGLAYVACVGGGGGGGASMPAGTWRPAGGGGGSGGITVALVPLTGSINYTIGANGVGGATSQAAGTSGGTTTFSTCVAAGGGGGGGAVNSGSGIGGAGGVAGAGGGNGGEGIGQGNNGGVGAASTPLVTSFIKTGTTGGGGGGSNDTVSGGGGNGAIGTGGSGGGGATATAGTGFGSGGGGGAWNNNPGRNGTSGVIYVFRF